MFKHRVILVVIGILLSLIVAFNGAPIVRAGIQCGIEVNDQEYPLKVNPGQGFEIITLLTITCNQASVPVTGRVDLFDNSTRKELSVVGFPVGSNPNSPQWSITATVSNKLFAPYQMQILHLRMVIWLSIGEGVPALTAGRLERTFQVEVGEATPTSYTTPLVIGQGTNSTVGYVYISSNSTISAATYDSGSRIVSFKATGPNATTGFTAVLLPRFFIDGSPVVVIDNGNVQPISLSVSSNSTHYLVSFGYPLTEHTVLLAGSTTIPEFGPVYLPLILSTLTVMVVVASQRTVRRNF
jgi:hypothetical protein